MGNIDPRTRIRKIDPRRQNGPEHCEHGNTKNKSKNFYLPKGGVLHSASCKWRATQGLSERACYTGRRKGHDLFAIPIVATINYATANRDLLETDDWLGNAGNRVLLTWPRPQNDENDA